MTSIVEADFVGLSADRVLHLLLCSQRLSSQFVDSDLWPHILGTLDAVYNGNLEAEGEFFEVVLSDLVQNNCYQAAAVISMKTLRVPAQFSFGLFSSMGLISQSSTKHQQPSSVAQKSLVEILNFLLSKK